MSEGVTDDDLVLKCKKIKNLSSYKKQPLCNNIKLHHLIRKIAPVPEAKFPTMSIWKWEGTNLTVPVYSTSGNSFIKIIENTTDSHAIYNIGDRVGQLIILPIPHITLVESDSLSTSIRGEDGFGSTNL